MGKLMKLKSRNQNKKIITAAIIAAAIIVLIAVGVVIAISVLNSQESEDPKTIEISEIRISSYPSKVVYFIGDEFEPEGTVITVINDKAQVYTVDSTDPDLIISGFDSSAPNDKLPLTITYKGHSITINVTVKEVPSSKPYLTSIRLSDNFHKEYSLEWWNTYGPTFDNVYVVCTYSDGSEKEFPMEATYCYGMNYNLTSKGPFTFVVKFSDEGIWAECNVTVTITN